MDFSKKTKIVCTIGPTSWDPEVMRQMIEAGMNVARVNGAFADEAELDKVTKLVRDVSSEVALMMDVKGPEVRMNKFAEAKVIKPGDQIIIGNGADSEIYPGNYADLYKVLTVGQRVVIGDGDTELIIKEIVGDKMHCEVVFGEFLKPGKALNLPGADFATSSLTEKDIINLKHSIKLGWDFVSASFVQNAESAREIKKYLEGSEMKLIAKIEDAEGVKNIDEILEEVEGVMVARGGLGVELGLEKVPMVEKLLIEKCVALGKPVITATQMLESMITNPRPTRAEVNDVATAVLMGSDSVMLSGESSAGKYPVEAVKELTKISLEIEKHVTPLVMTTRASSSIEGDAITKAAAEMCINMESDIDVVIIASRTGLTPRLLGRHRIKQPIYAFVSEDIYSRRLALSKGVNRAYTYKNTFKERDLAIKGLVNESLNLGIVTNDSRILFIGKSPVDGGTYFPNLFEVVKVSEVIA
ncbi:MAG: pyruvate kinase [Bacteroidota bacterium]|nr:pyruvate kinase [Bacteroidota bacterium]